MNGFWREMKNLGKDPNPFKAGFLQFVGVAENRDKAFDLYREPAEYFYNRCLHVDARYANPPGYTSEATMRAKVKSQVLQAARRATDQSMITAPTFEEIVDKGYVIIGSPDEVAGQLREVAINLNIGHLMLLLQFGNMGKELTLHNTELFAKQVMPQINGLFENEWQDEWWPQTMAASTRSEPRPILQTTLQ